MRRTSVCLLTLLAVAACGDNSDAPSGDPDAASAPDAGTTPDANEPEPPPPPPFDGEVKCERTVPRPDTGICTATAGTGTAVVVRGNILADGGEGLDGEVLYDGDTIVCVGCDCSASPGYATATQIDCGGSVVSAGLINAHDHLSYNNRPPLASTAAGGERFEHRHQWRHAPPGEPTNQIGGANGNRWNEVRQAMSGTTSMAASSQAAGMVRNVDNLQDADREDGLRQTVYQVFALGDGDLDGVTAPATCDWDYRYSELQVALMPGLVTHTSEGINDYAHKEFECQSSSLNMARDFTEKNVGHIHGVGLTAADYYAMVRDDTKLIWSPRSNVSLYGETARAPVFFRLGGTIALGTDWTYSGSATMNREMSCAAFLDDSYYGNVFTDEDIWRMATINAAEATGTSARLGSLIRGKLADIAVYRADAGVLHRAVIDATTDDVALVVRAGDVLFGEDAIVNALDASCEAIDVCGQARRVCAMREFTVTYATLAAAAAGASPPAYPAIFCDTPPQEPTCIPSRPGQYTGELTKADPDGDGVATATDNCPATFNPIRPMDHGAQADADGDGMGDGCDPTPIGDDLDGDGRSNDVDVCPLASDDGVDMDSDGKGDACDACATTPNPDTVCYPPPVTMTQIQTGEIARGTTVIVEGAIVTAIEDEGFYAQDPAVTSGENAGLNVFLGGDHAYTIGTRVSFAGTVDEYFDMTQIEGAVVLSSAAGEPIAPVALTVDAAQDEKFEGTLVKVTVDATTTIEPTFNCGTGCPDTNLWKINGTTGATSFIVVSDRDWQGTAQEWTAALARAQAGADVTGVMSWRFNARRILPRTPADIPAP
jgi:cytosine/adenosine deaminase-related metal-dependent hydrolase